MMMSLFECIHLLAVAFLVGKVVLFSFVVAPFLRRIWNGSRSARSFAGCFRRTECWVWKKMIQGTYHRQARRKYLNLGKQQVTT